MNPRQPLRAVGILLVLVVAFLLRLAALNVLSIEPISDFAHYVEMATTMAESGEMRDGYDNVAYYSAGYPLLLTLPFKWFGAKLETAHLVNLLLGTLSVWLVYLCALRLIPDWRWALIAAALWAVYPPAILYTEYIAKENLMIPLLLLQLYLLQLFPDSHHRTLLAAALGVVFAAGLLTGKAIILTGGIIALVMLLTRPRPCWRARAGHLLLFGVVTLATLSPWLSYTNARLGQPVLNTNGPFNLYIGNNPNNQTPFFKGIQHTPIASRWYKMRTELGEVAAMKTLGELAKDYMIANPVRTIKLALQKIAMFWYPPLHSGQGDKGSTIESLVRRTWLVFYVFLVVVALLPLVFWRHLTARLLTVYGLVLAYCVIHGAAYVIYRYRLPIMPLVTILTATGLSMLMQALIPQPVRTNRTK